MTSTQDGRYTDIRKFVDEVQHRITDIQELTDVQLRQVTKNSAEEGDYLQRIQEEAGRAVAALESLTDVARHARSHQAQAHQAQEGNRPQ